MDYYQGLKIIALKNVIEDADREYEIRKIQRWYSKNFHTELHLVEELPVEDILIHYFESEFEDLKPEQMERLLGEMTETEDEKYKRLMEEERVAVEDFKFQKQAEKEAKDKPAPIKLEDLVNVTNRINNAITNIVGKNKEMELVPNSESKNLPEDVNISFTDDIDAEIEKQDNWGLFDSPAKPTK